MMGIQKHFCSEAKTALFLEQRVVYKMKVHELSDCKASMLCITFPIFLDIESDLMNRLHACHR